MKRDDFWKFNMEIGEDSNDMNDIEYLTIKIWIQFNYSYEKENITSSLEAGHKFAQSEDKDLNEIKNYRFLILGYSDHERSNFLSKFDMHKDSINSSGGRAKYSLTTKINNLTVILNINDWSDVMDKEYKLFQKLRRTDGVIFISSCIEKYHNKIDKWLNENKDLLANNDFILSIRKDNNSKDIINLLKLITKYQIAHFEYSLDDDLWIQKVFRFIY